MSNKNKKLRNNLTKEEKEILKAAVEEADDIDDEEEDGEKKLTAGQKLDNWTGKHPKITKAAKWTAAAVAGAGLFMAGAVLGGKSKTTSLEDTEDETVEVYYLDSDEDYEDETEE